MNSEWKKKWRDFADHVLGILKQSLFFNLPERFRNERLKMCDKSIKY